MKTFFDIVQGTEAWHKLRYRKVGGSTSKQLFVKGDTLLNDLVGENMEDWTPGDDFMSKDMLRGHELEPGAKRALEGYSGLKFIDCGWIASEDEDGGCSLLGISPDGVTENMRFACEIKCPGKSNHTRYIREKQVPVEYAHQCVHYFTVNPLLEKVFFVSYRPESEVQFFVKELTRSSSINVGTKATPKLKTVQDVCDEAMKIAKLLQKEVADELNGILNTI